MTEGDAGGLEWDEAKRLSNLAKHGLDFEDAFEVFATPHFRQPARLVAGEQRYMATAPCLGRVVTVIYARRGDAKRIISMRRARADERRGYQDLHDR